MIREAIKSDVESILSLYQILFSEMALFDPERLQPASRLGNLLKMRLLTINFVY